MEEENETKPRKIKQPQKFTEYTNESHRWTLKEKEQFLRALYKYGHLDIAKIQSEVPSRSHGSIRSAIGHWKKEAKSKLNQNKWSTRKVIDEDMLKEYRSTMLQNTEKWISLLKHTLEDKSNLQYGLSNIFLIIAEVGDFPPPEACDGVDFREVYLCMHSIINGHPCKDVSIKTAAYMFDCFNRMQAASNKLGHEKEKKFLQEMYGCKVSTKTYYARNKNKEPKSRNIELLERMLEISDANPLKVPVELLIKQPM